ncbi:MAG: hypothetical protein ACYDDA_14170 [Acidiferrobacteraceae bacterium]
MADSANNIMFLCGVGEQGERRAQTKPAREQLTELIAVRPHGLIGVVACSGAHHFTRVFAGFGHIVHMGVAQFVSPS